ERASRHHNLPPLPLLRGRVRESAVRAGFPPWSDRSRPISAHWQSPPSRRRAPALLLDLDGVGVRLRRRGDLDRLGHADGLLSCPCFPFFMLSNWSRCYQGRSHEPEDTLTKSLMGPRNRTALTQLPTRSSAYA